MKKLNSGRAICTILLLASFSSVGGILFSVDFAHASDISVAVSIPDFVPIISNVGKEHVRIIEIMPPGSDPHGFTLTQAKMEEISNSDVIVLANSKLLSYEASIKTNYPSKAFLDFPDYEREGAVLGSFPGYSECAHGYWLEANNSISIARAFEKEIAILDPQSQAEYANNLMSFVSRVETAKSDMQELSEIHQLKGKSVVAVIPGVNYIIENMEMNVGFVLLAEGGGFASGSALLKIEQSLRNGENLAIVCPEIMKDAKPGEVSRQISEDTGAPVVYVRFLSPENEESYVSQLYYNAAQFVSIKMENRINHGQSSLYLIAIVLIAAVAIAEAYFIFRLRSRHWEAKEIERETSSGKEAKLK